MSGRLLSSLALALCVTAGSMDSAAAATINSWVPAGGGSWNTGANWSTAATPTATEAATFTSTLPSATNVVTLDGNQTAYGVNLVAGTSARIVNINAGTPAGVLTLVSTDQTTDGASTFQALSSNTSIATVNAPIRLGDGVVPGTYEATFNAGVNASNSLVVAGGVSEAAGQTWGLRIAGSGGANAIVSVTGVALTYSGDTRIANNGVLRLLAAEVLPNGVGKGNVILEGNAILRGQGNPGGFGVETINGLSSTSATSQVNLNQGNTRTIFIGDNNANGSFAGFINESNGTLIITKMGSGIQSIGSAGNPQPSNNSGTYNINAGTLLMNGSHTPRLANANGYTVAAAGTLGGIGSINQSGAGASTGAVAVNGTLAPGASTGTLDIARILNLNNGAKFAAEIGGSNPADGIGNYDQANMTLATGSVNLAGTVSLALSLVDAFQPTASDVFYILTRADAGAFTTLFAGTSEGSEVSLGNNYRGKITYLANWAGSQGTSSTTGGNDVAIYDIVPEPSSLATLAMAIGLGACARRRN